MRMTLMHRTASLLAGGSKLVLSTFSIANPSQGCVRYYCKCSTIIETCTCSTTCHQYMHLTHYLFLLCPFQVVGFDYGKHDETEQPYYETIYMLLDSLSPLYRLSFADCLASKLSEVVQRDTDAGVSRTAGDDES